ARPRDRCRGGGGGWVQMSGAGPLIGLRTIGVYYINSEFMSETFSFEPRRSEPRSSEPRSSEPRGIRLGVVRGISYGLFGPPGELNGDEELWITLCSSSPWGTRQPTDFLPPSPARDQRAYAGFVRQVVRHCVDQVGGGRVRYWQCDNEPSNTDLLWAGTAAEY